METLDDMISIIDGAWKEQEQLKKKYFKQLKEKIKKYPPERLLSLGKDFLRDFEYINANHFFEELKKFSEFRGIANLYKNLAFTLFVSKLEQGFRELGNSNSPDDPSYYRACEKIIENAISCMIYSSTMCSAETLSAKDFSEIELLIDRLPFKDMIIQNRKEFNQIYYKFKEYSLNLLEKQKDKTSINL